MKIGSKNIHKQELRRLIAPVGSKDEAGEQVARQLLFVARLTHPEKGIDDVRQELIDGKYFWVISMGESRIGMNYNPEVYDDVRFVEDLVN